MDRRSNRRRLHSRPDNGIYDRLILSGMDIPESVDTQKKAQENHSKMAETPVPSLILSLSVSTIFTMLIATSYNIVDTYFVSDLGESSVAAVGIMFSVMALIQAVGYTWGMGAGSEIARLLGKQKKREAEQTLATALAGGILSGAVMAVIFAVFRSRKQRIQYPTHMTSSRTRLRKKLLPPKMATVNISHFTKTPPEQKKPHPKKPQPRML